MSGSKRGSQYRKGATSDFLSDDVELVAGDEIAQVLGSKGANLFEIRMANGDRCVGLLPNKFRNLIWIKRNDFVVITGLSSSESTSEPGSAAAAATTVTTATTTATTTAATTAATTTTFEIKEILNKSHIKQLKARNLWPIAFGDDHGTAAGNESSSYMGDMGDDLCDAEGEGEDELEDEEDEEEEEERDARGEIARHVQCSGRRSRRNPTADHATPAAPHIRWERDSMAGHTS